jgi:hypothetical protein
VPPTDARAAHSAGLMMSVSNSGLVLRAGRNARGDLEKLPETDDGMMMN